MAPGLNPVNTTSLEERSRQTRAAETGAGSANAAAIAGVVLAAALALAWLIYAVQAPLGQQTEKAVMLVAAIFVAILGGVPAVYVLRARWNTRPEIAGMAFLATLSMLLLAIYFFWVHWFVFFSADIWIWSEGDYVNDMLKFSLGYPLYSAPANHDSYTYVPGSQLLTYFFAWIFGKAGSIPAYRVVQVGYTAAAAFVAMFCCRRILCLARPQSRTAQQWLFGTFCYAACFLMATNSITNRFTHNLHGDALAQLMNMTAFYLLLAYIEKRGRGVLAAMILLVPVGFLVKQNLLIWGLWYGGFLAVWGRSWKRLLVFAAGTAALYGGVLAACYALWGSPFYYWIFYLLSHHPVSPLRSLQHVLDGWPYFAGGLLGGMAVLRGRRPDALVGAWLVSLGLLLVEAYTSGIAWMLNHMGPGSLMCGIWFLAGIGSLYDSEMWSRLPRLESWMRAAAATAVVALIFNGMGLVRIPLRPISDDTYRYVRDIEKQFAGQPPGKVLLDVGTWVYLKDRVVMGDRAPCIGEEGYADSGDFSGIIARLTSKRYSRILVRDLHDYDFWYENSQWPRPRGLRKVLLDNYRETGRIRGAAAPKDVKRWAPDPYLFDDISILEPKPETPGS